MKGIASLVKTLQQLKTPDKGLSLYILCPMQHHPPSPPHWWKRPEVKLWEHDTVLAMFLLSLRLIIKILWTVGWKWFWRKCFQALQMLNSLRKTDCIELKIHSSGLLSPLVRSEFWFFLETLQWLALCWVSCKPLQSPSCGKEGKLLKVCSAQWIVISTGIQVGGWKKV